MAGEGLDGRDSLAGRGWTARPPCATYADSTAAGMLGCTAFWRRRPMPFQVVSCARGGPGVVAAAVSTASTPMATAARVNLVSFGFIVSVGSGRLLSGGPGALAGGASVVDSD